MNLMLLSRLQLKQQTPRFIFSQLHHRQHIATMSSSTQFYDFSPLDKAGKEFPLCGLKGKVVLVVNTASKCGFTPQLKGLEELNKQMREKHGDDFVLLGFPCNQFGGQDPGSNEEIQEFCQVNYGVSFKIMSKVNVADKNENKAEPLFQWLVKEKSGTLGWALGNGIKWNFEKFLIGRDGQVKNRWRSVTSPSSLASPILAELAKKADA